MNSPIHNHSVIIGTGGPVLLRIYAYADSNPLQAGLYGLQSTHIRKVDEQELAKRCAYAYPQLLVVT